MNILALPYAFSVWICWWLRFCWCLVVSRPRCCCCCCSDMAFWPRLPAAVDCFRSFSRRSSSCRSISCSCSRCSCCFNCVRDVGVAVLNVGLKVTKTLINFSDDFRFNVLVLSNHKYKRRLPELICRWMLEEHSGDVWPVLAIHSIHDAFPNCKQCESNLRRTWGHYIGSKKLIVGDLLFASFFKPFRGFESIFLASIPGILGRPWTCTLKINARAIRGYSSSQPI